MQSVSTVEKIKNYLRTLFKIRKKRRLGLQGSKPLVNAYLILDRLKMQVTLDMSDDLWEWLALQGWREATVPNDRRKYTLLPIQSFSAICLASREERDMVYLDILSVEQSKDFKLKEKRTPQRCEAKPSINAYIIRDRLKMKITRIMSQELWEWLMLQEWREATMTNDRRQYTLLPEESFTCIFLATKAEREAVYLNILRAMHKSEIKKNEPKPLINTYITLGSLKMMVTLEISEELWEWLMYQGWKAATMANDRRHYTLLPKQSFDTICLASPEDRDAVYLNTLSVEHDQHLKIKKKRQLGPCDSKPLVDAYIIRDNLKMKVTLSVNEEQWKWLTLQEWREASMPNDRRQYTLLPEESFSAIVLASEEEREGIYLNILCAMHQSEIKMLQKNNDDLPKHLPLVSTLLNKFTL
ncbi:MAG: hypothetical protein V4525_14685 [Pseudomonadota bacterium]